MNKMIKKMSFTYDSMNINLYILPFRSKAHFYHLIDVFQTPVIDFKVFYLFLNKQYWSRLFLNYSIIR